MPELPELDVLTDNLSKQLTGTQITAVRVLSPAALKTFDPPVDTIVGRSITSTGRRAKYVWLEADGLYLVIHLSLGGRVTLTERPPSRKVGLLVLELADGRALSVTESGTKKRAAVWLVDNPQNIPAVQRLGAEPLQSNFTPTTLAALLKRGGHTLKYMLTDQRLIAGIGNAWSDDALHAAKLSPFARPERLTPEETERLHAAIVTTLANARGALAEQVKGNVEIPKAATRNFAVHGRAGEACFVCGDTIRSVWMGERETSYCPTCQTGGRALADRRRSRFLK